MLDEEKNTNETPIENRPKISDTILRLVVFLVGFIGAEIIALIAQAIVLIFNIEYANPESPSYVEGLMIINSIKFVVLFFALLGILFPNLLDIFKKFKNWQNDLIGLGLGVALIGVTMIYSIIISLITDVGTNTNENYAEQMIRAYPVIAVFVLGIIGPICEEITYRYGLFALLNKKNKILAYIVTIVVFAFIHFDFTGDLVVELINLPPYLIAAGMLCFAYDKFGFESSIIAHVTNNMYAIIATLLIQQ